MRRRSRLRGNYYAANRVGTTITLRAIASDIFNYTAESDGYFPPEETENFRLAAYRSPYGHPKSGPDFVYEYQDQMHAPLPPAVVIAFDAAQVEQAAPDDPINFLAGDGSILDALMRAPS